MTELIISALILSFAFYLLKTMPDAKEEHLQDSQAAANDASAQAQRDDYDHLYNETNF